MKASFSKALVIGASSGIGEAVARRLAAEGSAVALVARRGDELQRVTRAIEAGGGRARPYQHDVLDYARTPELFERICADLGGLDLVVYAAGVMPPVEDEEYTFAKDEQTMAVNAVAPMAWLNLAAARFSGKRGGTIAGISSVAGERGRRGSPAYGASKAAFTSYLESLRNRTSRYGVNVVTIKPGFVDTDMTRGKKGMFWLVSADAAARDIVEVARTGGSPSAYVPRRWALIALLMRLMPSTLFRRLSI